MFISFQKRPGYHVVSLPVETVDPTPDPNVPYPHHTKTSQSAGYVPPPQHHVTQEQSADWSINHKTTNQEAIKPEPITHQPEQSNLFKNHSNVITHVFRPTTPVRPTVPDRLEPAAHTPVHQQPVTPRMETYRPVTTQKKGMW